MRYYIAALSMAVVAGPAAADNIVTIGGYEMRPGMTREQVLPKLRSSYKVACVDSEASNAPDVTCRSYIVSDKQSDAVSIANVVFEGNRVTSIRKYWGEAYNRGEAAPFAKTFAGLVSKMNGGPGKIREVRIAMTESLQPTSRITNIVIYDESRSIQMSIVEGIRDAAGRERAASVSLDEVVQ